MTAPLVMYWYRVNRDEMPLYGFSAKTIDLRPYFLILIFLIPLVVGASFTSDFQRAYPRYKFGFPEQTIGSERTMLAGIFQLCYGSDFVFVEFFFRGFMVLAFTRMMGTRAIVPMVVVYTLIHFQKPMLEAVSSIFGGLVLGVISYRTKSIYGGVILHLGVAYMMEIAGALQMPR
jgi:membrane protease YdiL (CAAX protease family)